MFKQVVLRGRDDFTRLRATLDHPLGRMRGQQIGGDLDLTDQLRMPPWIHSISLYLVPKLGITEGNTDLRLINSGPFPPGQVISSLHGSLPRHLPSFSTGIWYLHLTDVRFRSFLHLLRLIKGMPSLLLVDCTKVVWDALSPRMGPMPSPTSFLARTGSSTDQLRYQMKECTDDRGAFWLAALLGRTRQDIVDRSDAEVLCALSSVAGLDCFSRRLVDEIRVLTKEHICCTLVSLSPQIGNQQRRRIRSVTLNFAVSGNTSVDVDWSQLDELEHLSALQSVFLVFKSCDDVLEFRDKFMPFIPRLSCSPKLNLVMGLQPPEEPVAFQWIQISLADDSIHEVGEIAEGQEGWMRFVETPPHTITV
ncbi:hypothetical protein NM688_g3307 [Phlebia brevispora]|uniref:Uncharacterized protein n=1 Tax=Phlebia brevispora TaxID=194682 RepID=A0ACC1T670_9APHY|nr:hypothetical protein NM688_g3307 [Phlebia brevispora]